MSFTNFKDRPIHGRCSVYLVRLFPRDASLFGVSIRLPLFIGSGSILACFRSSAGYGNVLMTLNVGRLSVFRLTRFTRGVLILSCVGRGNRTSLLGSFLGSCFWLRKVREFSGVIFHTFLWRTSTFYNAIFTT